MKTDMLKYKLKKRDGDLYVYEYWDPSIDGPSGVVSYNSRTQELALLFLPEWDKYRMHLGHMVRAITLDISKGINVESGTRAWY